MRTPAPIRTVLLLASLTIALTSCTHFTEYPPSHTGFFAFLHRQPGVSYDKYGMAYDSQEDDPALKKIFAEADRKTERKLVHTPHTLGFIHTFWATKQDILRDDYGIHWKTPDQLNPTTCFD